jgi:hypothetical protein
MGTSLRDARGDLLRALWGTDAAWRERGVRSLSTESLDFCQLFFTNEFEQLCRMLILETASRGSVHT